MSLSDMVWCLLTGECPAPWDPDTDDDIKFLRQEKARAEAEAAALRQIRLTGPRQRQRSGVAD